MIANLIAVVAGMVAATLYIVGLSFSAWGLFLVFLSPLPIYMAGLGAGAVASGVAGAVAVIAAFLTSAADPLLGSVFSVFFVLPAFLLSHLAVQSREDEDGKTHWFPLNGLLQVLIVIGLLCVALVSILLGLTEKGLAGTIRFNLDLLVSALYAESEPAAYADIVDQWDSLVFGAVIATVMASQACCGALAQGLLVNTGRNLRPSPSFWRLEMPNWTAIAGILCLLVAFLAEDIFGSATWVLFVTYVATGFTLVFVVGFLLQGLAVMHALTRGLSFQFLILTGVYMIVVVFQPFGALTFAALGLADRWGNLRERFGPGLDLEMED